MPSANCIVVKPNSTVEFQPYCRAEIGSLGTVMDNGEDRYAFSTYLDPTKADKTIDYVKVIWQTTGVIGDNSDGSKVTLCKNEYNETAEDLELRTTAYRYNNADGSITTATPDGALSGDPTKTIWSIKVKTANEGNALIGAYKNVEEGEDILLWSWHIWCTDLEPDNIGNALNYTTYDWDNTKIYPNNAANEWNPAHPRIPGYGIMKCNLGATSTVPDASRDATYPYHPTRGMLFQWGRKDPFPPSAKSTYASDGYYRYTSDNVVPLYDNAGARITKMTDLDPGPENPDKYVFYSLAGKTTFTKLSAQGAALKYSIGHPTCFLCGTIEAGNMYTSNISNTSGIYQDGGDWNPDHDNRLWGGLEPDDALKHFVANASTGNVIYDNYGSEKSIFDPCPKGWRVSPPDLWLEFTNTGVNPTETAQVNCQSYINGGIYMYLEDWKKGQVSFFPLTGAKRADGMISHTGQCGNYHNATSAKNNVVNCMHMHNSVGIGYFAIFETNYRHYRTKSLAGPIRCVRDRK